MSPDREVGDAVRGMDEVEALAWQREETKTGAPREARLKPAQQGVFAWAIPASLGARAIAERRGDTQDSVDETRMC
eukprot:3324824-Rhodomonas_salina.2